MTRRLAALPLVLLPSLALAQMGSMSAPSTPPPPPPPAQVAGPETHAAVPVRTTPSAVDEVEEIRFRGGLSGGIGAFFPPNVLFGVSGRAGVQINRLFGVYLNLTSAGGFGFGVTASATGGSLSVSLVSYWQAALMADVTLGDRFFVGIGPALANGAWLGVGVGAMVSGSNTSAMESVYAVSGFMPGAAAQLGVQLGNRNAATGRRQGATISLDLSMMFGDRRAASVSGGTNGASVDVSLGTGVGVGALLMFGYEWR